MGFLLLAICYATFTRFAFNDPKSNLIEYSAYALVYVAFLAAPWIQSRRGHINVDMVETALGGVTVLINNAAITRGTAADTC